MESAATLTLESYDDDSVVWLESARAGMFDRYQIGVEPTGEGITEWFCSDCLNPVDDIDEGCAVCGLGALEEDGDDE